MLKHGHARKIASSLEVRGRAGLAPRHAVHRAARSSRTAGAELAADARGCGWNGKTFTVAQGAVRRRPKKFDGFNGIGFGANGRLYVGVDVGLTDGNDHGPAEHVAATSTTSCRSGPNGNAHAGLRQRACGSRGRWPSRPGSNAPFVTDLGQDSGAKNPPDFVLHVHGRRQDYGFPKCNHTVPAQVRGASPSRSARFGPHTDLMGIGAARTERST